MGFVSNLLEGESNIHWYYIVGILIFMALFIYIVVRTIRMKKQDIVSYKTSIFEEQELEPDSTKQ